MKKAFLFVFALICLMTVLCVAVSAEVFEGKAVDEAWIRQNEGSGEFEDGDINTVAPYYRIYYKLDTDEGVLNVFYKDKEQKMLPYARFEWVPWLKVEQRPYILEAVIEEGVLTVGRYSFYQCENLHTVYLPSSIYKIDQTVFYECGQLEKIYYAGTQEDFEKYVQFDKTRNDIALDKFVWGQSITVVAKNQHGELIEEYIVGGYHVGDTYSFLPRKYDGMTYTGDATAPITGRFVENDQTVIELIYNCDHKYLSVSEGVPCITACTYCHHANPNDVHTFGDIGSEIPCTGVCLTCGNRFFNEGGAHVYDIDPENPPCRAKCTLCDEYKNFENGAHRKVQIDEPSSLFKSGRSGWQCENCGANEIEGENAMIFYIGIGAACVGAAVVIGLAIYLPIRRHKKIKEMTW